ncbi:MULTISPECIES: type I-B CRISPR-associated protein Cas7/Cst2/DevR [Methanobacterium]|uniref:Type I-B CRISPR-associated protein Cas7/Cst2/DevR n=1 Tax=Methanobacterium veterum TaxID=408577 RepID=A0A9E5DJ01_9EURY|nr:MULTISPECIES: type I-B CRISPR-associated protein Cas7/Cst2/DevR [Methanobacterium]MCZ3365727.1 type I-B CRISPR-associated protein Cas7/Cst2/DevR [Methanobacterium veterum]MCZ3371191.1 type I-B CRISPR-associated protein Cas7/Cst2/DevR [Methanobacterium veterum]
MSELKGINMVWLSETDLTNLNAGEGESNYVDVKKYKKNGIEYPYVSGQAMRFYLREAIRRNLSNEEYMCVPDDKGETCGNISNCINCDLFGFMTTVKGTGAVTRVSPVKVSPAIGLLPFDDNSNVDFLTRRHRVTEGKKMEGDIVNVEMGTNIYKSGISIDLLRVGAEEEIDEKNRTTKIEDKITDKSEKISRTKKVIEGVGFISDYSKQARLLTDFTPDLIAISFQNVYSHRLQKLFELNKEGKLNKERFKGILEEVSNYSDEIFFGMISGILDEEDEQWVKTLFKEKEIEIKTPKEAIDNALIVLPTE